MNIKSRIIFSFRRTKTLSEAESMAESIDSEGVKTSTLASSECHPSMTYYGTRNKPKSKYVWNAYLLQPAEGTLHPAWILPIIHGFITQVRMTPQCLLLSFSHLEPHLSISKL